MNAAVVLVSSAVLGAACTRVAAAVAPRLGMVSAPNRLIPQHTRTVACLGGVAVFVAAAGVAGAARLGGAGGGSLPLGALAAGAAAFLVLGLWDDWRPLPPAAKLAWQWALALGAALAGLRLPLTGVAAVDCALAALWIVVVVNAANLVDVCDGLLGCVVVAALVAMGLTRPAVLPVVLPVVGATAGFLVYNLPPARVFLGDAGSHLLGFMLAGVALAAARGVAPWPALPWMALVVGVPLFELVFLAVVRTRKGLPWWRGSPDHFALRLQVAGLSRAAVDAVATLATAALAGVGAALLHLPAVAGVPLAGAVLLALAAAWRTLLRWDPPPPARP